ncbi:hypothetical protein AUJ14_05705 [Candidatus Micrarchaeota archaeon CG1_02_55_22]|nr:MAG: hypothetical protein AUJ14_05705 [Candidatus Micrarchaeota archaeon CG1_02_55_22]
MDYSSLAGNWRIRLVALVLILALGVLFLRDANPSTVDLNLGIEFVGGVRIPVTLERSVDQATMDLIIETMKQRVNKFGLSQAVVRPLGDNEILVEIPQADERAIDSVQRLLREQGKFEAIIDGKVALDGKDIIASTVGGPSESVSANGDGSYGWQIGFTATVEGGKRFSSAALGKPRYPVYMFLDRPSNALVIIPEEFMNSSSTPALLLGTLEDAAAKEGDSIRVLTPKEVSNESIANYTEAVVSTSFTKTKEFNVLVKAGFREEANASRKLIVRDDAELIPTLRQGTNGLLVDAWVAIGLTSSPELQPSLAEGRTAGVPSYIITGSGRGETPDEQHDSAVTELKLTKIALTQGRLPVSTVIGSTYTIAPSLGRQFLTYSAIGVIFAILVVASMIILRYRNVWLAIPIVIINVIEMLITLAIVGNFTLDLAAMAGIITLIGTGVDDQIIITDELLKKKRGESGEEEELGESNIKQRIGKAFEIIMTNALVAIVAMLPLLLSGIVEIMGFALAYVIGVLVGVFITRPAYGLLVGEIVKKHG